MKLDSTTMVVVAVVAALGLLVVVVYDISMSQQQTEAARSSTGECAKSLGNSAAKFCHNL